jgi:uncharacterized repeat protein (TIGR02543 family)
MPVIAHNHLKALILCSLACFLAVAGCIPIPVAPQKVVLDVQVKGHGQVLDDGSKSMSGTSQSFDNGTQVILNAQGDSGWQFDHWEGASTGTYWRTLITMNDNKTLTAVFKTSVQNSLAVTINGEGTVTPNGGTYNNGDNVTLTAAAASGWHFVEWTGDAAGTSAEAKVTMSANKNVTASFAKDLTEATLTIDKVGEGTVTPDNGTIYSIGTQVTLTATPAAGWHFFDWEGDITGLTTTIQITMDANKTVQATFEQDAAQYPLTINVQGQGSVNPQSGTFDVGTAVTLTATPALAWEFTGWQGGASGSQPSVQVTMDSGKTVTAVFSRKALPRVALQTNMGRIVLELDRTKAPITMDNFIQYVADGFYDGKDGNGATIFHRVIPNFMNQGGGFTADLVQKKTRGPITNESNNGLKNDRGTIAMARTNDPNSATAQFYINTVNNNHLNYASPSQPGYAVFGKVVEGMEVVDAISAVPTHTVNGMQDVPVDSVTILSAEILP